eukprot:403376826
MIKYAKNPELFGEYAHMRNEENEKFQEYMKKMKNVAESRKNMRVDMRPKVVAKIMTKEIALLTLALTFGVAMPLYFYKLKGIKEEYVQKQQNLLFEKAEEELKQRRSSSYINSNTNSSNMSTSDKVRSKYSEEELKEKIREAEQEYEQQAIRDDRIKRAQLRRQQSQ